MTFDTCGKYFYVLIDGITYYIEDDEETSALTFEEIRLNITEGK